MKILHPLVLVAAFLLSFTGIVAARLVHHWSYSDLFEKSDLVAIAIPTATNDTNEHIELPGFPGQSVIGVETRFAVSVVLKGDKSLRDCVLHHYRAANGYFSSIPNGPTFVSFAPAKNATLNPRTFILFLLREADGRYAPVVGQADPSLGVRELVGANR